MMRLTRMQCAKGVFLWEIDIDETNCMDRSPVWIGNEMYHFPVTTETGKKLPVGR